MPAHRTAKELIRVRCAEGLIELGDIGLGSFGYVTNPTVKKASQDRPLWSPGGSSSTLWQNLPNAQSSNGISDNHIFFIIAWNMLVVAVRDRLILS